MDTANSKANSAFFALVFTSKFSQTSVCRDWDPYSSGKGSVQSYSGQAQP